jgi:repeat uncharacterized protein DUF346
MEAQVNELRLKHSRWPALAAVIAAALALLAMAGPAKASVHSEHFCWGATIKPNGGFCSGLTDSAGVHNYAVGVWVTGIEHSVCADNFLQQNKPVCTSGPGQSTYLELNPTENTNYGIVYPNGGVQSNTTVYGIFYWIDPGTPPPPPPPSWQFQSLGSSQILGDPSLDSPASGALDMFAKGLDGNLWQRWANNGPWSEWTNVSAMTGSGPIASSPGSVSWGAPRVDIVARMSNGTVGHWYYDSAWHFENLGGSVAGDPDIASVGAGHLNVFAKSTNGDLIQKWWNGAGWSEWQDLSILTGSGAVSSGVGAVKTSASTLDVVARMPSANVGVWHWSGTAWSFESLSGQITGKPDVSSVGSGAANVFAEGLDGNLWQKWRVGSGWSEWQNVSDLTLSGPLASGAGPAAASWNSTRVDVVGRLPNGTVGHWWYGS